MTTSLGKAGLISSSSHFLILKYSQRGSCLQKQISSQKWHWRSLTPHLTQDATGLVKSELSWHISITQITSILAGPAFHDYQSDISVFEIVIYCQLKQGWTTIFSGKPYWTLCFPKKSEATEKCAWHRTKNNNKNK